MKPIGLNASLLYFGIPAIVLAAGFYLLMPALIKRGMLPYYAYSLGLTFAVLYLNNSSAGLVMHFISNGVGLVPILLGVLEK